MYLIYTRPCSDDGERVFSNTSQVPVLTLRRLLIVCADAGVQASIVGVDDVYERSLGASDLQLAALARVARVPAFFVVFFCIQFQHRKYFKHLCSADMICGRLSAYYALHRVTCNPAWPLIFWADNRHIGYPSTLGNVHTNCFSVPFSSYSSLYVYDRQTVETGKILCNSLACFALDEKQA